MGEPERSDRPEPGCTNAHADAARARAAAPVPALDVEAREEGRARRELLRAARARLFAQRLRGVPALGVEQHPDQALGIVAVGDIGGHPEKHGLVRAGFGVLMGTIGTVFLVLWLLA